jgi:uracil-DNA glycosylase
MDVKLAPSWRHILEAEFSKPYFEQLVGFVKQEYGATTIYPPGPFIFKALDSAEFDQVKVVIIGQDPYHGPGQANGLSFSVNEGLRLPPSLQNIYKEIYRDLGISPNPSGDLSRWAKQGVLLLNATLTVRASDPGSHQGKGWEQFTDAIIAALNTNREHLVFMLWGKYAQQKGAIINSDRHLVLQSAHPSPFSADRGFFGNKHFSRANQYLVEHGLEPIDWS